jgi:stage V sporulation protein G
MRQRANWEGTAMEITEVRIKLMEDSDDRLQAFCSITFDNAFVVRDLKIIDGTNGPFVAMPSRKLTSHCHQCGSKNHLKASYCNQCGARQREDRLMRDSEGRAKLYADIAHPINSACREMIQNRVIAEFRTEQERAKQPGYVSKYDDDYDDDVDTASLVGPEETRTAPPQQPARQAGPPPPHMLPKESPATSSGAVAPPGAPEGPHFPTGPSHSGPAREASKEAREETKDAANKNKPRGNFGAGVF